MSFIDSDTLAAQAELAWRDIETTLTECPLSNKQRLQIPLQEMPAQHPDERRGNMDEVTTGYHEVQAWVEAERCLQCPAAPCVAGCPVAIDIPGFIRKITERDYAGSLAIIQETSMLPAICGRVCPQEAQCQLHCTVGKVKKDVFQSVSIGRLERFVADTGRDAVDGAPRDTDRNAVDEASPEAGRDTGNATPQGTGRDARGAAPHEAERATGSTTTATGRKVAVIGSGPASITAAADLRRAGHAVTIFEAFHKPGGVLVYGIPEFRLPKSIVEREIADLRAMGVEIRTNFLVGRTRTLAQLREQDGYDAVFIGSGAGLPRFMNIEGENLVGVFAANEFLTRSNLMKAYDRDRADTPIFQPRRVAVLGGGNVAMDAARTAVRLGAEEVNVIYRRTRTEMPARAEEVDHAEEEGVRFHFLRNPARILGDEHDAVRAIEVLAYELGEPDESGRRRPVAIPGSEYEIAVDTVIVSIGNDSNPLLTATTPELETTPRGTIVADESGKTTMDGVWAGGDIVLGAATVILAMGHGRRAAAAINEWLDAQPAR